MILSQSPSREVERGRVPYRPGILLSVPLAVCPAESLGVPWSHCPGDYVSIWGQGPGFRVFQSFQVFAGGVPRLGRTAPQPLLGHLPSPDFPPHPPCVCPRLGTLNTALCSLPKFVPPQGLGFRIPSPKEHGNPESPLILALLLLPLRVTEFSGFPLDTSSEDLPPAHRPILAATTVVTHFLSWASATANLSPATSELLQSILHVLLLAWSYSDAKKPSVASHWLCIPSLQYVKSRPKTQAFSCFVKEPAVPC